MGSSTSTLVEEAREVTVEDHHNMIELRFDHAVMAAGIILISIILALACKRCRRRRQPIQTISHHTPPHHPPRHAGGFNVPVMWHIGTEDLAFFASAFRNINMPRQIIRRQTPLGVPFTRIPFHWQGGIIASKT